MKDPLAQRFLLLLGLLLASVLLGAALSPSFLQVSTVAYLLQYVPVLGVLGMAQALKEALGDPRHLSCLRVLIDPRALGAGEEHEGVVVGVPCVVPDAAVLVQDVNEARPTPTLLFLKPGAQPCFAEEAPPEAPEADFEYPCPLYQRPCPIPLRRQAQ